MEEKDVIGNLATFFTVGVFLSGISVCRKIVRQKTTGDISGIPFVCGIVNCSLWLRYGIFTNDSTLIFVNLVGLILQVLYVLCYGAFLSNKDVFIKQLIVAFGVLAAVFFYTSVWLEDREQAKNMAGLSSCTAAVLFMSSPLASLFHVIKTKSAECLPFYMMLFTFIMASLWVWYGILMKDIFIQLPNFLGAITSGLQLCLYYTFSRSPSPKHPEHSTET